jgi:WD40 repeat protein
MWDPATGAPIGNPLTGHTQEVNAVAVGQLDGRPIVVSGSRDNTVRMWDVATGIPMGNPLTGHTQEVNAVAVGQLDGRPIVVSGSRDNTIRVWDQTDPPISGIETRIVIDVATTIYGVAVNRPDVVTAATELGVIVLRLKSN